MLHPRYGDDLPSQDPPPYAPSDSLQSRRPPAPLSFVAPRDYLRPKARFLCIATLLLCGCECTPPPYVRVKTSLAQL